MASMTMTMLQILLQLSSPAGFPAPPVQWAGSHALQREKDVQATDSHLIPLRVTLPSAAASSHR